MKNNTQYIVMTESALDVALANRSIVESAIPTLPSGSNLKSKMLDEKTLVFACGNEHSSEFIALIDVQELEKLNGPKDLVYGRVARVLKAARNPPVHLPRSWAEFHHDNLLSFFAEPEINSKRWIAEIDGNDRCVRFLKITDSKKPINLGVYSKSNFRSLREGLNKFAQELAQDKSSGKSDKESFVKEFDLSTIGGGAVTGGQNFDSWLPKLSDKQKRAVMLPHTESLRIVGPAGSGKTLTLCMRAIGISKDSSVVSERKKILLVAHSWAMAERIDQILVTLNNGVIPDSITVLPLLSIIENHAHTSMGRHYEVLGDDSQEGSRRVMEILERVLVEEDVLADLKISKWIRDAHAAPIGSGKHGELIFDLYEEISGVIAAQGIFPGDDDKIADYYAMERGDNLPPFDTKQDRIFCMRVFEALLSRLTDRGLITTDQLILDAIRVFETFAWNVRRQTEGYDYILVDELQLFGPQERLAISLLSRTRSGLVWAAAEDPSQGVFSSLYGREGKSAPPDSIYLSDVHRFNTGLFHFVQFIYGKFPLNVPALKISHRKSDLYKPTIRTQISVSDLPIHIRTRSIQILGELKNKERLAIVVIGDSAEQIMDALRSAQLNPIQLQSFDDVESLTYQKKSIVVSPWQFIGGTQFSHVLLVVSGTEKPRNTFARLRELTAIYLGASRASEHLEIFCGHRIPRDLQEAIDEGVIDKIKVEG